MRGINQYRTQDRFVFIASAGMSKNSACAFFVNSNQDHTLTVALTFSTPGEAVRAWRNSNAPRQTMRTSFNNYLTSENTENTVK